LRARRIAADFSLFLLSDGFSYWRLSLIAKHALALHLSLQDLKSLVHIIVAYENLHSLFLFDRAITKRCQALEPLAYSTHEPLAMRPGYPPSILNFRLWTDTIGCRVRRKATSQGRCFLGSSSKESVLPVYTIFSAPDI